MASASSALIVAVAFWYIRKVGLPFWTTTDVFAPGIALGHVVGRMGCLFAGCCWGKPTDVAWDSKGNIYITDGYINSRVAKYDANGDWVKSFGTPGNGPGQLNTPHSIASDVKGNIYVADRGNRRIQVFNGNGDLQKIITIDVPIPADAKPWFGNQPTAEAAKGQSGQPWAVCITPPAAGGQQWLYAADAFPGRIYKMTLDGKVVGMLGKAGRQLGQFGWIHGMACPS